MALASFLITFEARLSHGDPLGMSTGVLLAFVLLVAGAFLVSFDLPLQRIDAAPLLSASSGILFAVSIFLLKISYGEMNFVNGYFWSRAGMFFAGFSLLLVPAFRKEILEHSSKFATPHPRHALTGLLFMVNKISGGIAALLLAYAVSLGPFSLVNALNGTQFAFVFILSLLLSPFFPKIYGEKFALNDWIQKAVAILLIILGIWLLSVTGGVSMLL
jgi:uncharacterized membrane protein